MHLHWLRDKENWEKRGFIGENASEAKLTITEELPFQ